MVALNPIAGSRRCPCTSGLSFGECCGKYHGGKPAPTAANTSSPGGRGVPMMPAGMLGAAGAATAKHAALLLAGRG